MTGRMAKSIVFPPEGNQVLDKKRGGNLVKETV
jgi:hypothetical protein